MSTPVLLFCCALAAVLILVFLCVLLQRDKKRILRELAAAHNRADFSALEKQAVSDKAEREAQAAVQAVSALRSRVEWLETALSDEKQASKEVVATAATFETRFMDLSQKYGEEVIRNENLKDEVLEMKRLADKSLSERKSSEVRTGKIAEHFAPLMEDFPYALDTACFFGMPIDFICFTDTGVRFVEVKTGAADLSSKQRHIRDLINDGKVSFEVYRMKARS